MKHFAFDLESFLIEPGLSAPRPVCLSYATSEGAGLLHAELESDAVVALLRETFLDPSVICFGANTAFDAGVILERWPDLRAHLFEAYEAGRVRDVQIDEQLIDIARGELGGKKYRVGDQIKRTHTSYSLAALEQLYFGRDRSSSKYDTGSWRLRYGTLIDTPLDEWDTEAVDYAIADAVGTLQVADAQALGAYKPQDSAAQARAALALHMMAAWGVKTDAKQIKKLEAQTVARFEDLTRELQTIGLVRSNGTRDTKAAKARLSAAYRKLGIPAPITEAGDAKKEAHEPTGGYESLDEEACEGSGDETLEKYAERTKLQSIVETHIPALWLGVNTPIQPGYKVLVESGRTSCLKGKPGGLTNGYGIQNVRRAPGLRECFTAREDNYFADADFSGLELCTVAQVCKTLIGRSALGDALNAGIDVHLDMAALILGIKYSEALDRKHEKKIKDARQLAKCANFGYPGGLGANGFIGFARAGYKMHVTEDQAKDLKAAWIKKWPEFRQYFALVSAAENAEGRYDIKQIFSNRVRGDMPYTAACNTYFQGLGADGAKHAAWAVARASYDATQASALFGFRPWGFVHDQILGETRIEVSHDQTVELGRVMVAACNKYLPDVPVRCEPCVSKHWTKDAVAVYDAPPREGGRLLPWDLCRDAKSRCWYADGKEAKW